MRFLWAAIVGLPGWLLIAAARCYQITLSPVIGRQCRFTPSCSQYFILAVKKYGAIVGTVRGIWRVCRCHPFNAGGYDPP